jgi:hypothetical protein
VGNEIDHVQARHALLVQVVHGVRVLLAKDGHQHVGAGDFLLAVAGGLHVHDGALDHALETQRGLGVHVVGAGDLGRVVLDEIRQRLAQVVDIGRAGAQHLGCAGVVEQASNRCSTVMNSWRCWRASTKAMCKLTSSSWAIM